MNLVQFLNKVDETISGYDCEKLLRIIHEIARTLPEQERKDFIKLIKAAEGVMILEDACKIITGCNLDEGQCSSIYLLWEVIRDNSAERFSFFL